MRNPDRPKLRPAIQLPSRVVNDGWWLVADLSMAILLATLLLVAASDFLLFDAEWGINLFLALLIIALAGGGLFRLVLPASRVA